MVRTLSQMVELGSKCPDFSLGDTEGETVSRSDFDGKPLLVIFMCNHCPYVRHIREKLAEVTSKWIDGGVGVVAINSNDVDQYPDDSPENMKAEKHEFGYHFPYLFDETQEVAQAFKAACTPDFFLYDREHKLAYRGQFDDARPANAVPVSGIDLEKALRAVMEERPVDTPQQPAMGCNIKWKSGNEPDYFKPGQ